MIRSHENLFRLLLSAALALAVSPASARGGESRIEFLERRVAKDPADHLAHAQLAAALVERVRGTGDPGDLRRARAEAEASLRSLVESRNPNGLEVLALVELESHRFSDALRHAARVREIDPGNVGALTIMGDARFELGDYDEADALYRELASHRRTPAALVRLARIAEVRGDEEVEGALLAEAGEREPYVRVQAARLLARQGRGRLARDLLSRTIVEHPDDIAALAALASTQADEGLHSAALGTWERAAGVAPTPPVLLGLAEALTTAGRLERAKSLRARALAMMLESADRGEALYLHHLAEFYVDEDPETAVRWAERDLELRHGVHQWDALAWATAKSGDVEGARTIMRKALSVGSRDPEVLRHARALGLGETPAREHRRGR